MLFRDLIDSEGNLLFPCLFLSILLSATIDYEFDLDVDLDLVFEVAFNISCNDFPYYVSLDSRVSHEECCKITLTYLAD